MKMKLNKLLFWENCFASTNININKKNGDEYNRRRKAYIQQFISILSGESWKYILKFESK